MYELMKLISRSLPYSHAESLQCVFRPKRVRKAPSDDLTGIGICYQVQVGAAVHQVNVSYVAHPELIGTCRNKSPDKVLIHAVTVVRVRRRARLRPFLHEVEVAEQVQERIASGNPIMEEHALRHEPQLVISDARVHLADLADSVHQTAHTQHIFLIVLPVLVVSLFASAKQFAAVSDCEAV